MGDVANGIAYKDSGFQLSPDTEMMGSCVVVHNGIATVLGGSGKKNPGFNSNRAVTRQVLERFDI